MLRDFLRLCLFVKLLNQFSFKIPCTVRGEVGIRESISTRQTWPGANGHGVRWEYSLHWILFSTLFISFHNTAGDSGRSEDPLPC